ncbi:hypothetical protein EJ04DRAFT_591074 [Polyplosphaeria fusca]|uniref:Cupin type-2 domain-containing protein n=1 Tax=Polyplosphaeria fusca TaxID=682080 RepID=A0A9P4UVU5_9PLEO|nr:hypothetical protein EJ04DRAFT_591074 [Polyplosphaeria fusca]
MMESPYSGQVITVFDGALTISWKPHPERDFAFEATFYLDHPSFAQFRAEKPPLHVHPHQEEYIQVIEGALALEVEGVEHVVRPEDGDFLIRPWTIHRLYTVPASAMPEGCNVVTFLASGQKTLEVFKMDLLFFENWYRYQDEVIRNKKSIDFVQAMCFFDAGGSYMTLPWWTPFRRTLSQAIGIIVGRWVAAFLGYQPYYRKWSTDWALAESKMSSSMFYRGWTKGKTE